MRGPLEKRFKNKYCQFQKDHRHDTKDCYDLNEQIERMIRRERLRRFLPNPLRKERREHRKPPKLDRRLEHDDLDQQNPPLMEIRTIVGGFF
ncbi:hypothetical protein U1Q18_033192 [Sarracenia purpurea var. burkii]